MLKRFSISLEENLLEKFDKFIERRKYTNRSEAIRDLIRSTFIKDEWNNDQEVFGVITILYNHHQPNLLGKITDAQHKFHHQVVSSTHIHVDHENCLEVVIVSGKASLISDLFESINSIRGVKNARLVNSSSGSNIG